MRASSMLNAMPRQVDIVHEGHTITLHRHEDCVILGNTLARHWTDETESVIMMVMVSFPKSGEEPERSVWIMAQGGPIPEKVAQQLHSAFIPDETVLAMPIPEVGGWVFGANAFSRTHARHRNTAFPSPH